MINRTIATVDLITGLTPLICTEVLSFPAANVASVAEAEAERLGRITAQWVADFLFRQASRANSLLRHFFILHIKTKAQRALFFHTYSNVAPRYATTFASRYRIEQLRHIAFLKGYECLLVVLPHSIFDLPVQMTWRFGNESLRSFDRDLVTLAIWYAVDRSL